MNISTKGMVSSYRLPDKFDRMAETFNALESEKSAEDIVEEIRKGRAFVGTIDPF